MNVHKNARLTPIGREALVARVLGGEHPREVAAARGVSVRTAYKWRRRFLEGGRDALQDRSSRPRHSPRRLHRALRRQILRLRRRRWSSRAISQALRLPRSTVGAELRRIGLGRLPRVAPPQPVRRYEKEKPGELVHLDTKKLGRFHQVGHRIHGDRHSSRRSRGAGWEIVYVAIDDCTRLGYVEILQDERGPTAADFLLRAAAWFAASGVRLERVMTDNGSPFVSAAFAKALQALGTVHKRTRPFTPRTNGKAERFIQTLLREWAYASTFHTSAERNAALPRYLKYYNEERPHMGIRGRSPQLRLQELSVNNVLDQHT
ncbi:MAG TPA: IS481 family transposase [Longimicrobiales bacterium]